MIFDTLDNIKNYQGLGRVYEALEFLAKTDFSAMELGRYELNDHIFYLVQEYDTKPQPKIEAHEKRADIQLLLSGEEVIGVTTLTGAHTPIDAKPEKDVWYYDCAVQPMTLTAGTFMVLYPSDIHQPGRALGEPVACRKIVAKILLED